MATLQVVTPQGLGGKHWRKASDYRFAAHEALCPLVAQEFPKAALAFTIGFQAQGTGYQPVAVLGLVPGQNLYVSPDGRWVASYLPAVYRAYPFKLAYTADQQVVLCVDTDSGLISKTKGDLFFNESGEPSPAMAQVIDFYQQLTTNRKATERACAMLQEHQLIRPWPITVQTPAGQRKLEGLYRIDEARLNALSAPALKEIQAAGALAMAYSQLLSMQHLPTLGQLAQLHAQAQSRQTLPTSANGELDLEFLNNHGTLSFGNL